MAAGGSLLIALIALAALTAGPAPAQPRVASTPSPTTATLDPSVAKDYWTPERLAAAKPLDLPADRSEPGAPAPELFSDSATPFSSEPIRKPALYPGRVHGKLYGYFPGVGGYACSATVVTSGSQSLITTAGHCVFDAGGSNRFASALIFIPGYAFNSQPYGQWSATNIVTTRQWVRKGALDYDVAMVRIAPKGPFHLERIVGSRGIGFDQPLHQKMQTYGYPASRNKPLYDGFHLIRCDSGYVRDPARHGGHTSRGMRCDMQQGSSGGGWVAQQSMVVSNISHGHPTVSRRELFGPYYGAAVKRLYRTRAAGFPSIGPITCQGKVATMIGTKRRETLRGTKGQDIIATIGGDDVVEARGGQDLICGGNGSDRLIGGDGMDRIIGGKGNDRCRGSKGNDRFKQCEKRRRQRALG